MFLYNIIFYAKNVCSKAKAEFTGSEAPLLPSSTATLFVLHPQMITPSWAENIKQLNIRERNQHTEKHVVLDPSFL